MFTHLFDTTTSTSTAVSSSSSSSTAVSDVSSSSSSNNTGSNNAGSSGMMSDLTNMITPMQMAALSVAGISVITKEALYHYTLRAGEVAHSDAVRSRL